jgi:hypothetical protein
MRFKYVVANFYSGNFCGAMWVKIAKDRPEENATITTSTFSSVLFYRLVIVVKATTVCLYYDHFAKLT